MLPWDVLGTEGFGLQGLVMPIPPLPAGSRSSQQEAGICTSLPCAGKLRTNFGRAVAVSALAPPIAGQHRG